MKISLRSLSLVAKLSLVATAVAIVVSGCKPNSAATPCDQVDTDLEPGDPQFEETCFDTCVGGGKGPVKYETTCQAGDQVIPTTVTCQCPPAGGTKCGNGVVDAGEQCDPGNGDLSCNLDCTFPNSPYCGNGIVDPGEDCDGTAGCNNCKFDVSGYTGWWACGVNGNPVNPIDFRDPANEIAQGQPNGCPSLPTGHSQLQDPSNDGLFAIGGENCHSAEIIGGCPGENPDNYTGVCVDGTSPVEIVGSAFEDGGYAEFEQSGKIKITFNGGPCGFSMRVIGNSTITANLQ